jgi:hypothetical protein
LEGRRRNDPNLAKIRCHRSRFFHHLFDPQPAPRSPPDHHHDPTRQRLRLADPAALLLPISTVDTVPW